MDLLAILGDLTVHSNMISLQAEGLSKKYNQKTILDGLSFRHDRGVLGIAGSNGSGKSTLLKCLAFLLRPQSGRISWMDSGTELDSVQAKALMGYTAPYINLYEDLTALENLTFLAQLTGASADRTQVEALLDSVDMKEYADQLFKSLSTGQQQRIKLASGLIRNPRILFLDEPGANLDSKGQRLVSRIVEEQKQNDCLVIIASNDPAEIALCDQVIELAIG